MSTTPHLGLPLLAASQAQGHVTHNEALFALDALVQCAVLDKDLSSPPATPGEGDRYIVGPSPTGDWAGKAGLIVLCQDGVWQVTTPRIGFLSYVADEALLYVFTSTGWRALTDALTAIQNLSKLGIGTTADATNPFSAKLNKALWTARGTGEGGTGDLRYTLNKETTANVLSLLFQTGYSGRFEFGLIGTDSFGAKVSPDGVTWRQALALDPASGSLDFMSAETVLASAATVDLGAQPTRRVAITGTTTITSFGTGADKERLLRFAGTATLVHNATSLILPGGADIAAGIGDTCLAVSDASGNWRILSYQRAGRATDALAPGSVRPATLALVDTSNMLRNPNFEVSGAASSEDWSLFSGTSLVASPSGSQLGRFLVTSTTSDNVVYTRGIPIRPGEQLSITFMYRNARTADVAVWHNVYDKDGSIVYSNNVVGTNGAVKNADALFAGNTVAAPAGAFEVVFYIYASSAGGQALSIGRVVVRPAVAVSRLADAAGACLVGATAAGAHADLSAADARAVLGLAATDAPTLAGLTLGSAGLALAAKTFATLPTASGATGQSYRVTDRNQRAATSDGTNWRWGDNAVAS